MKKVTKRAREGERERAHTDINTREKLLREKKMQRKMGKREKERGCCVTGDDEDLFLSWAKYGPVKQILFP